MAASKRRNSVWLLVEEKRRHIVMMGDGEASMYCHNVPCHYHYHCLNSPSCPIYRDPTAFNPKHPDQTRFPMKNSALKISTVNIVLTAFCRSVAVLDGAEEEPLMEVADCRL